MQHLGFLILLISAFFVPGKFCSAQNWLPDSLGHGYQMRYVELPDDWQGHTRCTLIRLAPRCSSPTPRAVLYIHGYNDYFFQRELGEQFADHCYSFYALDLSRYGRSLLPTQRPFLVRDFRDYFIQIDSALNVMKRYGADEIVLMGHSTGGLIAAYYMATHLHSPVNALILNSPFLDWNLGKMECFINLVSSLGRYFPNIRVSTGGGGVYAASLEKSKHGEWEYDTTRKSTNAGVDLGWVRAVNKAQHHLRQLRDSINVPILLMSSTRSCNPKTWSPEASQTDVVLDVNDIRKYGAMLGPHVTYARVSGGVHDLILSAPPVRKSVYKYIFSWLSDNLAR